MLMYVSDQSRSYFSGLCVLTQSQVEVSYSTLLVHLAQGRHIFICMHAHLGFGSLLSMFILCEDEGGEAESDQGRGVTHPIPLCRIPPSDPLLVLTLSHHR